MQDRIEVQGGKLSGKSIIVQGENKRAGGIEKTQNTACGLNLSYFTKV